MTPLYRGFAHFTRKNVPHRNKTAARLRAAGNISVLFVRAEFFVTAPFAQLYPVRPCFSYPAGVQPLFGVGVGHRTFSNGPYRRRLVRGGYARKYGPRQRRGGYRRGRSSRRRRAIPGLSAQHVLFIFRLAKFQVKPCPRTYGLHPAAAFVNSVGQVCGTYFCRL